MIDNAIDFQGVLVRVRSSASTGTCKSNLVWWTFLKELRVLAKSKDDLEVFRAISLFGFSVNFEVGLQRKIYKDVKIFILNEQHNAFFYATTDYVDKKNLRPLQNYLSLLCKIGVLLSIFKRR